MAWLRLLRSFRPVDAVRLDLVPRATREATAAAELEKTCKRPGRRQTRTRT